jgi:hypothetical protein
MAKNDPSHHAFKRAGKTGPGPKKRVHHERGDWECQKGKNTAKAYVQICTYVGDNRKRRGAKMKVVTPKAKKKAYNKRWRKWAAANKRIKAFQARGYKSTYKCRSTRVTKCR